MNSKVKRWSMAICAVLMMALISTVSAAPVVDHSAVLSGKVSAQGLVSVGMTVSEGDVLVNVGTIAGIAPTSRSKVTGVVTEVLVAPGEAVKTGQVIVRVEPKTP
jgi:Acetyl/propionyl-CoA carboxylase, alpha subunit